MKVHRAILTAAVLAISPSVVATPVGPSLGSVPTPSETAHQMKPYAADAGLAPSGPSDGCELHVWPAERMGSVTTGLLGGGLLDAALHAGTDANNKTLLASALDSPSQLDALQTLDLRPMLNLTPGTTIIRHEAPLERSTMNKVKTRRSDSSAPCYGELIVADVFYQKAAIYGRSLRTLFMYRKFDAGQHIAKEYKAWGGNGLKLFPPKEGEDAIAALDELVSVYKKNFEEYSKNARTALTRSTH